MNTTIKEFIISNKDDIEKWSFKKSWSLHEAVCLCNGELPYFHNIGERNERYNDSIMLNAAIEAIDNEELKYVDYETWGDESYYLVSPVIFLNWAHANDFDISPKIAEEFGYKKWDEKEFWSFDEAVEIYFSIKSKHKFTQHHSQTRPSLDNNILRNLALEVKHALQNKEIKSNYTDPFERHDLSIKPEEMKKWLSSNGQEIKTKKSSTNRFNSSPSIPITSTYSTPYLRLMSIAINELNISKDNQLTKKEITYWLSENYKKAGLKRLSGNESSYLATFIRYPESKIGGLKKTKG